MFHLQFLYSEDRKRSGCGEQRSEHFCPLRAFTEKKSLLQFPLAIGTVYRNELGSFRESVYNDKCGSIALEGDQ